MAREEITIIQLIMEMFNVSFKGAQFYHLTYQLFLNMEHS